MLAIPTQSNDKEIDSLDCLLERIKRNPAYLFGLTSQILNCAIKKCKYELVSILLENNIRIKIFDNTVLSKAIIDGDYKIIELVLENNFPITCIDPHDFLISIEKKHFDTIKIILKYGYKTNYDITMEIYKNILYGKNTHIKSVIKSYIVKNISENIDLHEYILSNKSIDYIEFIKYTNSRCPLDILNTLFVLKKYDIIYFLIDLKESRIFSLAIEYDISDIIYRCIENNMSLEKIHVLSLTYFTCELLIRNGYKDELFLRDHDKFHDLKLLILLIKHDVYCLVKYFNGCILNDMVCEICLLLKLGYSIDKCYNNTFVTISKRGHISSITVLLEKGYNINGISEEDFEKIILSTAHSEVIELMLVNKYIIKNISQKTFSTLVYRNNINVFKILINNGISVGKCLYDTYIQAKFRTFPCHDIVEILEKNRYLEIISDLKIKRTVLIALTSASRNNQINYYMSGEIIRYCSYFTDTSINDMIEQHVFRTIFKKKL
jgi:hypothetical protein